MRTCFDLDFGLTLPRLLVENGLTAVGNEVRGSLSTHGDVFNTWFNSSVESARPVLDGAFADGGEQLIDMLNRPGLWSTTWLVVSAWGTRPSP